MKIDFGKVAFCILIGTLVICGVPFFVGIITTVAVIDFNTESQWIGFWGNYLGALIGGIVSGGIAIYVMTKTFANERNDQKRNKLLEISSVLIEKDANIQDQIEAAMISSTTYVGMEIDGQNSRDELVEFIKMQRMAKTSAYEIYALVGAIKGNSLDKDDILEKIYNESIELCGLIDRNMNFIINCKELDKEDDKLAKMRVEICNLGDVIDDHIQSYLKSIY